MLPQWLMYFKIRKFWILNDTLLQVCNTMQVYHTVQQYCIVGTIKGGGRGPQRNQPSGIIHGHLIVLVRYNKPAQMCLQSDPKRYERFSTYIMLLNFPIILSSNSFLFSLLFLFLFQIFYSQFFIYSPLGQQSSCSQCTLNYIVCIDYSLKTVLFLYSNYVINITEASPFRVYFIARVDITSF